MVVTWKVRCLALAAVVFATVSSLGSRHSTALWKTRQPESPATTGPSPPTYTTQYFEQQLDHFNYVNNAVYKQRYLSSDVYWKGSGPMFFYTGNEGAIEDFYDNTGFLFTLAQKFKALIVFAEHRYYGKSLPFGSDSFEKSNLGYLSAEQALADFAVLIDALKMQYQGKVTKVITFGGSYGGMLSAWLRMKYPNSVDGALAASAPIFYVSNNVSRTAFFQRVTEDFAGVDSKCPDYVREGFSMIDDLAGQGETGLSKLTEYFSLCETLTQDKVDHLKGWVRNSFTSLAMVDYPYPASFLAPLPAYPVRTSCGIILGAKNRAIGLAQGAGLFYNGTVGNLSCFDIMSEYVDCADPTGCGTGPAATSWDYQACTEMMLPSDTNNDTDMFPASVFDPSQYCMGKFGVKYRKEWMKIQYWGTDLRAASNIIFSNGNLDPWSIGGVTSDSDIPQSVETILIEGGAHHLDLRFPDSQDPPSVTDAREKEHDIISLWLGS